MEFAEKGLGMLHLKKVDGDAGSTKTQLLVRAETNLGNILLNILINKQMNMTKRNNCIQFVCVPYPEIKGIEAGSPVTMLVKVKNADIASILEDEIKKEVDKCDWKYMYKSTCGVLKNNAYNKRLSLIKMFGPTVLSFVAGNEHFKIFFYSNTYIFTKYKWYT